MRQLIKKYRIICNNVKLKTAYNLMFRLLVILPICSILMVVLVMLYREFKQQAIENIEQMQETIVVELTSDIKQMSMRLASLVYANDLEIVKNATLANTNNSSQSYYALLELDTISKLYIEPDQNIISLYFYMKQGVDIHMKSYINREKLDVTSEKWYQDALKNKDKVMVGSYTTVGINDLYKGGSNNSFILIFLLSPQISMYKEELIEVVQLYYHSSITERIKNNNNQYLRGKNKLGITEIIDENGLNIYTPNSTDEMIMQKNIVCISTPVEISGSTWYINNYITEEELTETYREIIVWVLLVALVVFILVGYYSRFFWRNIIIPIEKVHNGLAEVESGNLNTYIVPEGQYEIRNVIHQYNGMVKSLRAFKEEYEENSHDSERSFADYYNEIMNTGTITDYIKKEYKDKFNYSYVIIGIYISYDKKKTNMTYIMESVVKAFQYNSRYATHCNEYVANANVVYLYYRILELDYQYNIKRMVTELQDVVKKDLDVTTFACIGTKQDELEVLNLTTSKIEEYLVCRYLENKVTLIELENPWIDLEYIMQEVKELNLLANALCISDEKNMVVEREKLFESFHVMEIQRMREKTFAIIIAVAKRLEEGQDSLVDIFGQRHNYIYKIERIEDAKSLRLWITNFLNWILEYCEASIEKSEVHIIVKAKRYIIDHYEDASLSVKEVAEYVGLNEKYFTNRFTKEAGETFTGFLTDLRIQKAKDLLKSTNFKVYEIAEMVGYKNVEHFNRVFKKEVGMSPTTYRK
ncbi:MAG: helix-turn-helix domain-containing protein [Eubacteriales bacterium]